MTIEVGTKVRILKTDNPSSDWEQSQGFREGAEGVVVEKIDRWHSISTDREFPIRFPETEDGEAFFFTYEEEGEFWERVA
jgi:hypothetical protein